MPDQTSAEFAWRGFGKQSTMTVQNLADVESRLTKLMRRAQRLERGHSRISALKLAQTRKKIAYLEDSQTMTDKELVLSADKTARLEKSEAGQVRVIAFHVDRAAVLSCWWASESMAWFEAAKKLGLR